MKAALLLVALLGTGTILLTYLLARRLAGADRRPARALLAATYPAFIDNNGRLLAEPVALFWLPAAMLAFLWASDGGRPWRWLAPGALLGLTTLTRPEYLPFVALFALLALARVWLGHRAAACSPASPPRRCSSPPSAPCWRPGRPATRSCSTASSGHHGRRQGAVRRHLPARRRPPAARQAPADRELLRQEGPPLHRGARDRDGAAAQPGRQEVPRPRPRRRAGPDRARELPQVRDRAAASTTPGW